MKEGVPECERVDEVKERASFRQPSLKQPLERISRSRSVASLTLGDSSSLALVFLTFTHPQS